MKEKLYGPLFEWLNEKGVSNQEIIITIALIWFTYRLVMKIKYRIKENKSVHDKYDYISDILIVIAVFGILFF